MTSKPHTRLSIFRTDLATVRDALERYEDHGPLRIDNGWADAIREIDDAYSDLLEQNETLGRLLDRAAELLHNSEPPRRMEWHDRFEEWLADVKPLRTLNPAKRPISESMNLFVNDPSLPHTPNQERPT